MQRCEVDFVVPQDCQYSLAGFIESFDSGFAVLSLQSASGTLIHASNSLGGSTTTPIGIQGVLLAGTYNFRLIASGFVQDGSPADYASGAYDIDLLLSPLSSMDCIPAPNSTGEPALLTLTGQYAIGGFETFYSIGQGPPNEFGLLFYGTANAPQVFGSGFLCVATPLYRFPFVEQFDSSGRVSGDFNFSIPPLSSGPGQVFPGSTWTFQFWFRDVLSPQGSTFQFSSATTVTFAP